MNLANLLAHRFPQVRHELHARDCMLYALGLGLGHRFEDASELQFCYEDGLRVFPSMVNVIAHPGLWVKEPALQIDWIRLLHAEQRFAVHRPLRPDARYVGSYRVEDVVDRGTGRGALLYVRKELREDASTEVVASVSSVYLLRGDGGCGSTRNEPRPRVTVPTRAPDSVLRQVIPSQAALVYRLSGDYNPIHASPEAARKAGFEHPILQGLCTLGFATHAVIQMCGEDHPERLQSLGARFTAPVHPGETLETSMWRDGPSLHFQTRVPQRNVIALDSGEARWAA
jgi:acyl dehydratase